MLPTHYRIKDKLAADGVFLFLEEWIAIRQTPSGYWVERPYAPAGWSFKEKREGGYLKWVSNNSQRRYCYPSISDAIRSFEIRKKHQIQKLRLQLQQAEKAAEGIPKIQNLSIESLRQDNYVGMPECLASIEFNLLK